VRDFWQRVLDSGAQVPTGHRLDDLTQELFEMLGDPDPGLREGLAHAVLAKWVSDGVYDDLLQGLADGAAAGLTYQVGNDGDDSVFRRSCSASILAVTIGRDNLAGVAGRDKVLTWGDRATGWLTRERDLRGFVPGKGWAHAVAHGADVLGQLARSPYLGPQELTVLLDVVADRLLTPTRYHLVDGETDRMAYAVMALLHRNLVPQQVLDPWIARLAAGLATGEGAAEPRTPAAFNTEMFLRGLHLQLATGVRPLPAAGDADVALFAEPPTVRADLILTTVGALRSARPGLYR
jgi:hypothetical protein